MGSSPIIGSVTFIIRSDDLWVSVPSGKGAGCKPAGGSFAGSSPAWPTLSIHARYEAGRGESRALVAQG